MFFAVLFLESFFLIYTGKTKRCHAKFPFPSGWNITHSPKHWSNEETMIEYVEEIILPYVNRVRQELDNEDQAALVIIDNFKGQITPDMTTLLEDNDIHTCLLPANTTDRLQPLDIAVNKPAKDFLKKKFELWLSEKLAEQLNGMDVDEVEFEPTDLSLPAMRELGARWLVEMAEYISSNKQFITNGFKRAGIVDALAASNIDSSSSDGDDDNDGSDGTETDFSDDDDGDSGGTETDFSDDDDDE